MTTAAKPGGAPAPKASVNKAGLSKPDYRGLPSTLCAGCGHDSIASQIIQSAFELSLKPHEIIKLSGIGYRTLPGTDHPHAAYFTRGSGHNENAGYTERPDDWLKNMARLTRKHDTARTIVPKPVIDRREGAKVGIIAFGTTDPAIVEARDRLRSQQGIETSYMRLRALPLGEEVRQFIAEYDRLYVVELNTDGQMHKLLQLHTPEYATKLVSIAYNDGLPLTPRFVTDQINGMEQAR